MTDKLEILIIDDMEENRNAAKTALSDKADIDFATNYEDGLRKMQTKVYAFGIFDLELPRKQGMEPEKLGYNLADEANKQALDHALITAGIDHHQCKSAFVRYCWDEKIDDWLKEHGKPTDREYEIKLHGFNEMTEIPKNSPRAWQKVYEELIKCHNKYAIKAKKKCFEISGKMFQNPLYKGA
jgi:response regulator RpfG family c-di-GMP phosphodiesterase